MKFFFPAFFPVFVFSTAAFNLQALDMMGFDKKSEDADEGAFIDTEAIELNKGEDGEETASGGEYETAGHLIPFLALGYSLPIIDLYKMESGGGIPIIFGASYTIIDNLSAGLRFRITPLFSTSSNIKRQNMFDFQAFGGYYFVPGLLTYASLGIGRYYSKFDVSGSVDETSVTCFAITLGASYTFYLADKGGFGFDLGAEFNFNLSPNYPDNTVVSGLFMYPLLYVGGRFSIGLKSD